MSEEIELRTAWAAVTARGTAARRAGVVFDDVVGRYREPHRRYHGVRHVVWVARHVRDLAAATGPVDLPVALGAAFFHDAVYDPRAHDNEERSALLAEHALATMGWPPPDAAAVARYVRATAGHLDAPEPTSSTAPPGGAGDSGLEVFLDADLAVLGADPAAYRAYAAGVRAEYGHLDDLAWRAGRAAVLRHLLARPAIYRTPAGRARWEAAARANLTAEIAALG